VAKGATVGLTAAIIVDSNNSQAGVITGNGSAIAPNINFSGSYSTSGSGTFQGTIKTYVAPTPDPLAILAAPNPASLTTISTSTYHISNSGTYSLQPGVYQGGIQISANGPGQVTLQPGIYYMQGGGFSISGGINVSGSGVMIYNDPSQNSDQIKLTGNGSLTLSAPTSGTYKGIAISQNRTSTAVVAVTGNGSMNITGTVYAAKAEVDVTGNGASNTIGSQYVANNMKVTGNGAVDINATGNLAPQRDIRIVE
jgi:hypothetical protein